MKQYFVLIVCVFCASFGHVLFKLSANTLRTLNSIYGLALEPVFIFAIFLYGVATLGWVWCLQEIPLSQAYLFMSLAYVFIPLMSWIFFEEAISLKYLISVAFIVVGITLAAVKVS